MGVIFTSHVEAVENAMDEAVLQIERTHTQGEKGRDWKTFKNAVKSVCQLVKCDHTKYEDFFAFLRAHIKFDRSRCFGWSRLQGYREET